MTTSKGGRPATGSVKWRFNPDRIDPVTKKPAPGFQWWGRVQKVDGSRPFAPLDASIGPDEEPRARVCAVETSRWLSDNPHVDSAVVLTVSEFSKSWIAYRRERGISSVDENERRLRLHILPELGHLDVTRVTRDDLEAFVEKLEKRATGGGDYDWRYAIHIWGDVHKMFKDAMRKRGLRVRDDNPAAAVEGPQRGVSKTKQYIYPSEGLAFLACPKVPRLWKRLWAISTYQYMRPEEVEALEWPDIDLEHGTIHIHRAVDRVRNKGKLKATKTDVARRVPIEPALLPLLEAMHERADGKGRVFPKMPPASALARRLRRFLKLAGIERDIFTTDATRRRIDWYGATRGTGITWQAVRGDIDHGKLMARAGHEDFKTTLIYIREAENLSAGFGEPFPTLPVDLWDPSGGFGSGLDPIQTDSAFPLENKRFRVGATGFENGIRLFRFSEPRRCLGP